MPNPHSSHATTRTVLCAAVLAWAASQATPLRADPRSQRGPRITPSAVTTLDDSRVVTRHAPALTAPYAPYQSWPALNGRATGLLLQSGPQPWGLTYGYWGGPADDPERDEYVFSTGGSSPYALYFPSPDGRGRNFMPSWSVPTPSGHRPTQGVAMFGRETPNAWGLRGRAHLVELEVNGGAGAAAQLHFVATNVRILDGAGMAPEAVLVALRRRFERHVDALGGDFAVARAYIRAHGGASSERFGMAPSWDAGRAAIVATVTYSAMSSEVSGPAQVVRMGCPPCPCDDHGNCAPCVACVPVPQTIVPRRVTTVNVAARYVVDLRRGVLLEEELNDPAVERGVSQSATGASVTGPGDPDL